MFAQFFLYQPLEVFENKCLYCVELFDSLYITVVMNLNMFDLEVGIIFFLIVITVFVVGFLRTVHPACSTILLFIQSFISAVVSDQTSGAGQRFIVFSSSVFWIILFANTLGLVPFSLCITSQFIVTFSLSFSVFVGLTLYGFLLQGLVFLYIFVPKNVPVILLPFLVVIEIISYVSRTFSLSIRLFANMVAGHALLHILMGAFVTAFKAINILVLSFLMIFPFLLIFIIVILETGIAFLQAYVFIVLISIYMVDSLGLSSH